MHGYLLVKPLSHKPLAFSPGIVFLGDGLERIEGVQTDFLKNVGKYISKKQTLEVFGEFTYAEVAYIKKKNPGLKLKVVLKHDPVDYQRTIKESEEIHNVRKSMQIVEEVFKLARREIKKPGMTEIRLAKFIQDSGLKMGANDLSFPAIVASGANAAVPHHVPANKKLKAGESIILDFGFKYKNYCSDFTRTVFLGYAPKKLAEAYSQVEKAYNGSIQLISNKKQVTGGDAYKKSVEILAEKKLDKYFIHSLGHGTGLEIHELPNLSPNSKDIMRNNIIFSIEPGVYIPKEGGIRIEDLIYLDKGKVRKFIKVSTALADNII